LIYDYRTDNLSVDLVGSAAGDSAQVRASVTRTDTVRRRHGWPSRQVGVTFGGAAVIRGNLTPGCAAAVRAVAEALGKEASPENDRTETKRFHDALSARLPAAALCMPSPVDCFAAGRMSQVDVPKEPEAAAGALKDHDAKVELPLCRVRSVLTARRPGSA
jgi:hypothetical protein